MKSHRNPGLYREMSEPFASADEANAALDAFYDGLAELRKQHRIADVHVIVQVNLIASSGREGATLGRLHLGNSQNAELMTAWSLGAEQSAREQAIAEMLKGKS